jgi:hypothetical protein
MFSLVLGPSRGQILQIAMRLPDDRSHPEHRVVFAYLADQGDKFYDSENEVINRMFSGKSHEGPGITRLSNSLAACGVCGAEAREYTSDD